MIRILLIRHGDTELTGRVLYGRMPGVHLSPEGHLQAKALAKSIAARYQVDQLVSSPLERAMETARYLSEAVGLPITTHEGIIELDYGAWLGKNFEDIRESSHWQHYSSLRSLLGPPDGELLLQVQTRAWTALRGIMESYRDAAHATLAVVSHGDVIRALLVLLLGMPLDNIHRMEVSPASLNEIVFDGHYGRILRINQLPF
ncbi:MAG: histidine phosphatase family protein [Bryobacteraceae bacterium]